MDKGFYKETISDNGDIADTLLIRDGRMELRTVTNEGECLGDFSLSHYEDLLTLRNALNDYYEIYERYVRDNPGLFNL